MLGRPGGWAQRHQVASLLAAAIVGLAFAEWLRSRADPLGGLVMIGVVGTGVFWYQTMLARRQHVVPPKKKRLTREQLAGASIIAGLSVYAASILVYFLGGFSSVRELERGVESKLRGKGRFALKEPRVGVVERVFRTHGWWTGLIVGFVSVVAGAFIPALSTLPAVALALAIGLVTGSILLVVGRRDPRRDAARNLEIPLIILLALPYMTFAMTASTTRMPILGTPLLLSAREVWAIIIPVGVMAWSLVRRPPATVAGMWRTNGWDMIFLAAAVVVGVAAGIATSAPGHRVQALADMASGLGTFGYMVGFAVLVLERVKKRLATRDD